MSEPDLWERLAAGDEDAARQFEATYASRLERFVRSRGVPIQDCADLVQEVFLAAVQQLRKGAFSGRSTLGTWLVAILNHKVLDYWQGKSRSDLLPMPVTSNDVKVEPPSVEGSLEDALVVRDAVARLPEQHRAILLLHESEGWTTDEIATRMHMRSGTVGRKLWEAQRMLRSALSGSVQPTKAKKLIGGGN